MSQSSASRTHENYQPFPVMKDYILTERLGEGTYATVYKGYRKNKLDVIVAIKCIERKKLTHASADNLLTEIGVMKKLHHKHIVKLEEFEWNDKYIFLILEYCAGGDLSIFIRSKAVLIEKNARRFLRQLALALKFLRQKGIAHMDLKPQNLLLTSHRNPILKVADFGMAQHLHTGDSSNKFRGSPLYMAPEIMLGLPYDAKVDLWSVGVILYETLFGVAPFASKTFEELEGKIIDTTPVKIPSSPSISSECQSLLEKLLERNQRDRISFEDFFDHPFVDLDHMPGPDCLPKARELVIKAVSADSEGNIKSALQHYTQAIEYFMPAMQFEEDSSKREELKIVVEQYIQRAEELNKVLGGKQPSVRHAKAENLLEHMKNDNPQLKAAYMKVSNAQKAETSKKFRIAFDLYKDAVELLLPIGEGVTSREEGDFIKSEIQDYLNRAEEVLLLSQQKPRFGLLRNLSSGSDTSESRCRMQ